MSDVVAYDLHTHARRGCQEPGARESAGERRTATRADLLDAVAAKCPGLTRGQTREIFEMALGEVSDALARGESVKLRSFGLFNVREKRERIGRNPRTGVEVPIKPRRVLTFKPSPVLLDQVNGREPGKGEKDEN
jgi:integration host factor subunit alpha